METVIEENPYIHVNTAQQILSKHFSDLVSTEWNTAKKILISIYHILAFRYYEVLVHL
jgi:hypothetical protein